MAAIKCPKCGSTDKFYIRAWSNVEVDGDTGYVEDHDGFEWDGTSLCTCDNCYHEGYYQDFKFYQEEESNA